MNFVHLHTHSCFSIRDGVGKIAEYIAAIKADGQKALCLTEHGNLYSFIEAYQKTKEAGIKLIIGCEMYICNDMHLKVKSEENKTYHLTVLAKNNVGYQNLVKLVSLANSEGFYSKPRIDKKLLAEYSEGLIVLSGCLTGEVNRLIQADNLDGAEQVVSEYLNIFKDDYYIEVMNHGMPEEDLCRDVLAKFAKKYNIKIVATNDVHYVEQKDSIVQDAVIALRDKTTLDDPNLKKYHKPEFYLKTADQMAALFPDNPEYLETSIEIANKCNVVLNYDKIIFPEFVEGRKAKEKALREACLTGWETYIKPILKDDGQKKIYADRVKYELDVINNNGFTDYFLIVQDFMAEAKRRAIPVSPGRGSAAGSLVSYILGITGLDPLEYGLYFERFLNPGRISPPDIDLDFADNRREEIIDYAKKKYGKDRFIGMITFGTFKPKAAIKDAFRVYGYDLATQDKYAKLVPLMISEESTITFKNVYEEVPELLTAKEQYPDVFWLAEKLEGNPRNSSTHASAFILTDKPITEYAPLDWDSTNHTVRLGVDMYSAEYMKLLKMDFLGIETLSIVENAIDLVNERHGIKIVKDKIPLDDEKTWKLFQRGDTVGIFQFESAGMRNLLRKANPRNLNELADCNAIYRPGAAKFIPDYCSVKAEEKEANPIHPLMEPVLKETYGVCIFQEQVMSMCQILAGFTTSEADYMRKAIGKKKKADMDILKPKFMAGCQKNGIDVLTIETILSWFSEMSRYNFNKSHALGYSMSAYHSAYVKANYPFEFQTAMMNKKTKKSEDYLIRLHDGKRRNIIVRGPHINQSEAMCSIQDEAIYFGMELIKGAGSKQVELLLQERKRSSFIGYEDFWNRCALFIDKTTVEGLIKGGAFSCFGLKRKWALENLELHLKFAKKQRDKDPNQFDLFSTEESNPIFNMPANATNYLKNELLGMEKEVLGFAASGSPLDAYKEVIQEIEPNLSYHVFDIPDGTFGKFVGIIKDKKVFKDKNGNDMAFFTLEDDFGEVKAVVFSKAFETYKSMLKDNSILLIDGRVSNGSVMVNKMKRLGNAD